MEQSIALNLGAATTKVVDVVALESDEIIRSIEIHTPVSVAITCGTVRGDTIKVGVGDSDAVVGTGSEDEVLTADTSGLYVSVLFSFADLGQEYRNMVNPDHISSV